MNLRIDKIIMLDTLDMIIMVNDIIREFIIKYCAYVVTKSYSVSSCLKFGAEPGSPKLYIHLIRKSTIFYTITS